MAMTAKRNKKKMRFKLLVGCHWDFLPDTYDEMTDEALRELAEDPVVLAALADKGQKILPADGREAVLKKLRLVNQGMYRENGDGAGNIIETMSDLTVLNGRGKHPKYERLEDRPTRGHVWDPAAETIDEFSARMREAAPPTDEDAEASASDSPPQRGDDDDADLDALPNLELRQIAKDRGIDLHGVSSKKDIIARIRGEAVVA